MREYDEYQKFIRYKNGTQAFLLLSILLFLNSLLNSLNVQWGETYSIETLFLLEISIGYYVLKNTYQGAFFDKYENPKRQSLYSFLWGLIYLYLVHSPSFAIFIDGKISQDFLHLFVGIICLAIPMVFLIRTMVDKSREKKREMK
ncbi:DUF6773 family protein [Atopococcus tabaci]|uniref:DUF6773 family protein n=1 Tax=Atopococcus tabaci TaxID=269774 RepID=UPI000487DCC2|nr:DUF6773 family protein [Atopococcus tabaci]